MTKNDMEINLPMVIWSGMAVPKKEARPAMRTKHTIQMIAMNLDILYLLLLRLFYNKGRRLSRENPSKFKTLRDLFYTKAIALRFFTLGTSTLFME